MKRFSKFMQNYDIMAIDANQTYLGMWTNEIWKSAI